MISRFTLESSGKDTWVAFGDSGKKVNIVFINKQTHVPKRRECAFLYMTCEIGPNVDNPLMIGYILEANMVQDYLFLPCVGNPNGDVSCPEREEAAHLCMCPNEDRIRLFTESVNDLKGWMKKRGKTDPEIS